MALNVTNAIITETAVLTRTTKTVATPNLRRLHAMPVLSMFDGIIVLMYYFDNRKHHRPHIHVQYSDQEAVISIPDGNVIEGLISAVKLKLVQTWIEIHQDELVADWNLAVSGQPVFKIDPLDRK